ncbi:MAG: NUDIX domain-containing protein [Verrucomicrobiota bacterium]
MPSSPNELFDVVDENDQVIDQATRGFVHAQGLRHRAVHILVYNSDGQLYLQKRSMNKDQMPGAWTTSASGHVDAGESYDEAAKRELEEELGIPLGTGDEMDLLFKHPACRKTGEEFIQVYRLSWNGPIVPEPEEIDEGAWLNPDDLDELIRNDRRKYAPSFRMIWGIQRGYGEDAFFAG